MCYNHAYVCMHVCMFVPSRYIKYGKISFDTVNGQVVLCGLIGEPSLMLQFRCTFQR
jgi:hypothetical protein